MPTYVDGELIVTDLNGGTLILDADGDTSIGATTDDLVDIKAGGKNVVAIVPTGLQDHGFETRAVTTNGDGTGLITRRTKFVIVTSDLVTKRLSLPVGDIGDIITISTPATGCELVSAVAGHTVNDVVVGATNELALAADSTFRCEYVKVDTWIVRGFTNLGANLAALVPDAR